MATTQRFDSFPAHVAAQIYGGKTLRFLFCAPTAAWGTNATMADILPTELEQANGYARPSVILAANATWNATDKRAEFAEDYQAVIAAAALSYRRIAVVIDGAATANKVATADHTTDRLTVTAHGLSNGDRVMLTPDTGGVMPAGLSASTLYHAKSIDANTLELYTNSGLTTQATFTGNGSGALRLRYGNGVIDSFYDAAQTKTFTGRIDVGAFLSVLNTGVTSGG